MPYLNASIPPIEGYVRCEFMRDHEDMHGEVLPCVAFAVSSIPGRVPCFHILMEDGAVWWRMPIHAIVTKPDAPVVRLQDLVLWDCFSYHVSVNQFTFLQNLAVKYRTAKGGWEWGRYRFTLDWASGGGESADPFGFAESPGNHKCGHIIERTDGTLACQPNNRMLVNSPSFTPHFGDLRLNRRSDSQIHTAEGLGTWKTDDSEAVHYEVEAVENGISVESDGFPLPTGEN